MILLLCVQVAATTLALLPKNVSIHHIAFENVTKNMNASSTATGAVHLELDSSITMVTAAVVYFDVGPSVEVIEETAYKLNTAVLAGEVVFYIIINGVEAPVVVADTVYLRIAEVARGQDGGGDGDRAEPVQPPGAAGRGVTKNSSSADGDVGSDVANSSSNDGGGDDSGVIAGVLCTLAVLVLIAAVLIYHDRQRAARNGAVEDFGLKTNVVNQACVLDLSRAFP